MAVTKLREALSNDVEGQGEGNKTTFSQFNININLRTYPMKTTMNTLLATLVIAGLALNTGHAATYNLSGAIDASQAITNGGLGAGDGSGTGTVAGSYDDVTNLLDYTITWQDLLAPGEVTNMHFHFAPAGEPGGVDLGIPAPWSSPLSKNAVALSAAQETNLLDGNWYLNIHSSNFGGGEIRGQVFAAPVPEPSTACMAGVAFLALASLARHRKR